jgi:hypothetical protein
VRVPLEEAGYQALKANAAAANMPVEDYARALIHSALTAQGVASDPLWVG